MSRILITGGAGFIGSYLEPELIKRGHEVHIMDKLRLFRNNYHRGDICDYICMHDIFKNVQPDVVYHFGAMVSRKECEETPQMAIHTNITGTLNVCHLSQSFGSRLIYSGSSEEYGTSFNDKDVLTEKTPCGTATSIYSLTKHGAGEIVDHYQKFKELDAITLRFFTLYGPSEPPTEYRSAIARFVHYALHDETLTVHKNTERGWCYITDAVNAIAAMADKHLIESGELFNIGSDDYISAEDLAKTIIRLSDSDSNINLIDVEPTIIPTKYASYDKIKKRIGWRTKIDIEEGLRSVIDYQRIHHK